MALFEGLFGEPPARSASNLFSDDSRYKRPTPCAFQAVAKSKAPGRVLKSKAERQKGRSSSVCTSAALDGSTAPTGQPATRKEKKAGSLLDKAPAVGSPERKAARARPPARGTPPTQGPADPYAGGTGVSKLLSAASALSSHADKEEEKPAKKARRAPQREEAAERKRSSAPSGLRAAAKEQKADDGADVMNASNEADASALAKARAARRSPEEEAERLERTIFVGNVPPQLKPKRLKQILSRYGRVESVRLRSVPTQLDSKLPSRRAAVLSGRVALERGPATAYLVFADAAGATAALAHNMQEVEGLHVRVDRAGPPRMPRTAAPGGAAAKYDCARTVFLGNLPFDVHDEEVLQFMSLGGTGKLSTPSSGGTGAVSAVRVVRDAATRIGKGIAFVEFATRAGAAMALARDGQALRGRPVRVVRAGKRSSVAALGAGRGIAAASTRRGVAAAADSISSLTTRFNKGARARGSGASGGSAPPVSWQGTRTKGKGKVAGAREQRPAPTAKSPQAQRRVSSSGPTGGKKRPAVAARKQATKRHKAG